MKTSIVLLTSLAVVLVLDVATSQDISPQAKPIDPANMDLSVKPCDDFFRYANGDWMKKNTIPAAYDQWGSFNILAEQNNVVLRGILEDAARDASAPDGSNK